MSAPTYSARPIPVDDVFIVGERRPLIEEAVNTLVRSIGHIGLQTPITVRIAENVPDPETGEVFDTAFVLVAGRHRHEACRRLGWKYIQAIVRDDCDKLEAELIEIAENLHRVDLTKEQRDQQIRRYAELLEMRAEVQSRQNAPIESKRADGRGHRLQGVASKIAASTGLSKSTVNRALNPKPTPAKPKEKRATRPDLVAVVRDLNVAWSPAAIETATSILTTEQRADLQQHLPDVLQKFQRLAEPPAFIQPPPGRSRLDLAGLEEIKQQYLELGLVDRNAFARWVLEHQLRQTDLKPRDKGRLVKVLEALTTYSTEVVP